MILIYLVITLVLLLGYGVSLSEVHQKVGPWKRLGSVLMLCVWPVSFTVFLLYCIFSYQQDKRKVK